MTNRVARPGRRGPTIASADRSSSEARNRDVLGRPSRPCESSAIFDRFNGRYDFDTAGTAVARILAVPLVSDPESPMNNNAPVETCCLAW